MHTINNNICDANPLDNSSYKAQITWHCLLKQKLYKMFSEFDSAIMAKHKLNTLKQNDTPMHEYISKFTSLTRHTYNVDPSTSQTEILILPFIDSLQNPFIKVKSD